MHTNFLALSFFTATMSSVLLQASDHESSRSVVQVTQDRLGVVEQVVGLALDKPSKFAAFESEMVILRKIVSQLTSSVTMINDRIASENTTNATQSTGAPASSRFSVGNTKDNIDITELQELVEKS